VGRGQGTRPPGAPPARGEAVIHTRGRVLIEDLRLT